MVAQLAEIFLAQAEQSRAVELGVAADVVVGVRMEFLAVLVAPDSLVLYLASTLTTLGSQLLSRGERSRRAPGSGSAFRKAPGDRRAFRRRRRFR